MRLVLRLRHLRGCVWFSGYAIYEVASGSQVTPFTRCSDRASGTCCRTRRWPTSCLNGNGKRTADRRLHPELWPGLSSTRCRVYCTSVACDESDGHACVTATSRGGEMDAVGGAERGGGGGGAHRPWPLLSISFNISLQPRLRYIGHPINRILLARFPGNEKKRLHSLAV